jgi:hypothetical protein
MSTLSDILSSLASGGASNAQPKPAMPMSPNYVPEDAVTQQYNLANQLRRVAPATSWAGVAAQGLGAIGGNLVQGDANNALSANQALRKSDIANAANATDLPSLEKSLITAQTPDIQNIGLQTKIKQISDDPNKEYRVRLAQGVQAGLKGQELTGFALTGQLPSPNSAIDAEYKRAEIEKLRKVDPVEAMVANMLGPQSAPAGQPSQPPPATLQPQNYTPPSAGNNPLLMNVSDTRAAPAGTPTPAPAQTAQASSPGEGAQPSATDIIDTPFGKMSRADAIRQGGALTLSPKYAAAGKALLDAAQTGGAGIGLGKQGENTNDKNEIANTDALAQFKTIAQQFDPKYLNIPQRFNYGWNALKEKFGTLPDADRQDLAKYTAWRGNSWKSLNLVLKQLSGTAVTGNELQRQLLDQPNPGTNPWDGDSPTEFATKLNNQTQYGISAIARERYLRNKGFTGIPWNDEAAVANLKAKGAIPEVSAMPKIINERGAQIEQELKQKYPNADPTQLQGAVDAQIKQEFGI